MTQSASVFDLDAANADNSGGNDYNPDKRDVKVIKNGKFYIYVSIDGEEYFDFRGKRHEVLSVLTNLMSSVAGNSYARNMGQMIPVRAISRYGSVLVEKYREQYSNSDPLGTDGQEFFKVLVLRQKEALDAYMARRMEGTLDNSDVPLHYTKGMHVIDVSGEDPVGGIIESVELRSSFMGSYWVIELKVLHSYLGAVTEGEYTARIPAWGGLAPLAKLPLIPAEGAPLEACRARGVMFRRLAEKPAYMFYTGDLGQSSWMGNSSYQSDGRVMVDPWSMQKVDSNRWSSETRAARLGIDTYVQEEAGRGVTYDLQDEDLWRTYPKVLAFSFRCKKWGTVRVAGLREIQWREDAFTKLVMEPEKKEMIRSLVVTKGERFQDLVEGKGGGTIFLLEGPPGLGKTLTAETVAEMTRQPLYAISVGELGTDPESLEETLRTILDVATIWDAVLLLDEADIFLEARDAENIVRNAMVGVFLRLLEYHQGILFLTTNRAENIDHAFLSRISLPLRFPPADPAKLRQIWVNLLASAGLGDSFSEGELDYLAGLPVNGRQIKNAVRIAQTLALAERRPVELDDLLKPVRLVEDFTQTLARSKRPAWRRVLDRAWAYLQRR